MKYVEVKYSYNDRARSILFVRSQSRTYSGTLLSGSYDEMDPAELGDLMIRVREEFGALFDDIKSAVLELATETEGCCDLCYHDQPYLKLIVKVGAQKPKTEETEDD